MGVYKCMDIIGVLVVYKCMAHYRGCWGVYKCMDIVLDRNDPLVGGSI